MTHAPADPRPSYASGAMNDDWRLHIDLHDEGFAHRLGETLQAEELEHDLERSFHDKVVVSVDGGDVFCYAGSRAQAEAVQRLIDKLIAEHSWQADVELTHWHPRAERWEPADEPGPVDPAHAATEHAERIADERAASAEQGYPEYEVRVQTRSRHDARQLVEQLEHEQIPAIHRWSVVLIGANDSDAAQALADRVRNEHPGLEVAVELNGREVWKDMPGNPFAVLGGLAG
jgi:hypothetical protein